MIGLLPRRTSIRIIGLAFTFRSGPFYRETSDTSLSMSERNGKTCQRRWHRGPSGARIDDLGAALAAKGEMDRACKHPQAAANGTEPEVAQRAAQLLARIEGRK